MADYGATGVNASLSSSQFFVGDSKCHAWNLEVWGGLTCGGPLDAPDNIPAGACHSNWHAQLYVDRN